MRNSSMSQVIIRRAAGAGVWGFDGFADGAQAGQHHHRQGAVNNQTPRTPAGDGRGLLLHFFQKPKGAQRGPVG